MKTATEASRKIERPSKVTNFSFVVEGPLMGFIAHAAPWSVKAKRYVAYKKLVRLRADCAGVPQEIPDDMETVFTIHVWWKRKAQIDTSNILKAIEDALWARDRGIAQINVSRHERSDEEKAVVSVRFRKKR